MFSGGLTVSAAAVFQYTLQYSDSVSNPLNSNTWYTVTVSYDWEDFTSANFSFSVDGYSSGSIDVSGLANPGKCTGFTSEIISSSQPEWFYVANGSGPGTAQDESAFYSEGLLMSTSVGGMGCEQLGQGTSSGSTVFANTGISNADASNSAELSIDVYVPSASGGSFSGTNDRVLALSCGDGGGLSTDVFLAIVG